MPILRNISRLPIVVLGRTVPSFKSRKGNNSPGEIFLSEEKFLTREVLRLLHRGHVEIVISRGGVEVIIDKEALESPPIQSITLSNETLPDPPVDTSRPEEVGAILEEGSVDILKEPSAVAKSSESAYTQEELDQLTVNELKLIMDECDLTYKAKTRKSELIKEILGASHVS